MVSDPRVLMVNFSTRVGSFTILNLHGPDDAQGAQVVNEFWQNVTKYVKLYHPKNSQLYVCADANARLGYNNCEYIKNLYIDFKIIETSWSYGMNKSKKSSEIVIIG